MGESADRLRAPKKSIERSWPGRCVWILAFHERNKQSESYLNEMFYISDQKLRHNTDLIWTRSTGTHEESYIGMKDFAARREIRSNRCNARAVANLSQSTKDDSAMIHKAHLMIFTSA